MRNLIILRGAPGCGKSTWIRNNDLENYTLSADDIRLLVQSPVPALDGTYAISQKNDAEVWRILFELLEKRMEKGEMVVIDATYSRSSDFSRYNKLCSKYRYRRFYVDFSDVPIETCKQWNKQRPEYKIVPEAAIDRIYSRLNTQQKTSGWVEIPKDKFWETLEVKCFDFNKYKNIYVIGDIHSTFTPLENFFKSQPYNEDNFYIFCGDYLDRGTQPRETMKFLIKLSEKKNVLFLTGNHERFLQSLKKKAPHFNDGDEFFLYRTNKLYIYNQWSVICFAYL